MRCDGTNSRGLSSGEMCPGPRSNPSTGPHQANFKGVTFVMYPLTILSTV